MLFFLNSHIPELTSLKHRFLQNGKGLYIPTNYFNPHKKSPYNNMYNNDKYDKDRLLKATFRMKIIRNLEC